MIQNILLVAAREFRQIAMTRSFWLTLLILPLAFAVGPIASRFMDKSDTQTVMLVDKAGGRTAAAIRQRIELDQQRATLDKLARYVRRHDLQRAAPAALWAQKERWYSDADVAGFMRDGGLNAALAKIRAVSAKDAEAFETPPIDYRVIPTPANVATAAPGAIEKALEPHLRPGEGAKAKPVDYVVLIPAAFGATPNVRIWTNGRPRPEFVQTLQGVLTQELRMRFLQVNGVAPATAAAAGVIAPAIQVTAPPTGDGRERVMIRSILPLACVYLLLMSLLLSGSWLLQSTVEERSNKLLETVIACVSPNELMYGKLLGTVAVGLSMVATWIACALFAAFFTQGTIAEIIRPALEPVSSIGSIATILFFFIAGYLVVSMLFLVIGVMSDSMREAQGYLTPVLLVIMMPLTVLMPEVLRGGSGIGVQVMTWIPLYTPFAVLARLGSGIPSWEVIGAGLMLVLFMVAELLLLGRVFRASLLNGGRRPGLGEIVRLMGKPG
ncbi:ABC transporter permease [Sphingomonas sp. IC-56]|uniref:ABC transporter permease n=1 Tax=Sphingomonas sp. IC-56 TaxID=2898529 RepID=UPI001E292A11|nr:ABC transporter permease [Sphingomonas sp. IC-56]MCD2323164.1 ABC transporter permease [Sphingomonas sp. IC-56]